MQSIEPQCAIAYCGISRFRVWSFGPSRNDGGEIIVASPSTPPRQTADAHPRLPA
ncbi:hypothetical protein GWE18_30925 [Bradyrhizobium sp. CSA112]|nr:hypothetical protein [Bradyrhizobium sp. CSA112]